MQEKENDAFAVNGLVKVYKGGVRAVDGVSLKVKEGEIFGILGPNGAGKSTVIKVLVTLIDSTEGTVSIFGLARPHDDSGIRKLIGYVPQDISADGSLTGMENIVLSARLHGLRGRDMDAKIIEVLKMFGIADAKDRLTSTYSGGMIRKLEIAQALVNTPKIIFLDEPTVGLDPAARETIWKHVRMLRDSGMTVVITTHYMDEADVLCDRIAIMSRGRIVAMGTPARLKAMAGKAKIMFTLQPGFAGKTGIDGMHVKDGVALVSSDTPETDLPRYLSLLSSKGITVRSASIKETTLDDVFVKYAGGTIEEEERSWSSTKRARKVARRLG